MTPAERTAKIAELRAEADRLEREGKRNWPEKLREGQVWRHIPTGKMFLSHLSDDSDDSGQCRLTRWENGLRWDHRPWFAGKDDEFEYLGHARDLFAIKTPDAPEPTGAELVAPQCEFSTDGVTWERGGECLGYDAKCNRYLSQNTGWRNYARLYRKDRP